MKIDFYVLSEQGLQAEWSFACKLIEKAYTMKQQTYIFCNCKEDAYAFDEFLWQFNPNYFIPHHIQGEGPQPPPPVQIGYEQKASPIKEILINLSHTIPASFKQYKRIIEIVPKEVSIAQIRRQHYRFYHGHQFKIDTHHQQMITS